MIPDRPTHVRWLVFGLACGMSWLLYLHRYSWNIIGPLLEKVGGIDNTQSGFVFSLFYWTYAAGQVPSGVIVDRFGPHRVLATSVILWSATFACFAVSARLFSYGVLPALAAIGLLRALFGAGQAACYPALNKVTRNWFPPARRTFVQGWVATAFGRGGGAMAPIVLATLLMGWCGFEWQTAVVLMGAAGIAFGVVFLAVFRNSPHEDPRANAAERALIDAGSGAGAAAAADTGHTGRLPPREALRNRSLRVFVLQQFLDAGSDVAFVYLLGKYFLQVYHVDMKEVGILASLPLWGGALGGIVGGLLNDHLIERTGSRRWTRSGIGFVGKVIGCVMLVVVTRQETAVAAGVALLAAKFFSDWSQPTVWGTCTDLGGRCSATVFSIINTAGTIGGIVMPLVFGRLLDWNTRLESVGGKDVPVTNWTPLLVLLAGMYLASGLCWLKINCTDRLEAA